MISAEILKARKTGIGGSDVAAILGLSQYKTAADVWIDKTNPNALFTAETEAMRWGNRMESVIATEYAERNGVSLKEPRKMYRHEKYPFLIANPDRLVDGKNVILECKTTDARLGYKWGEEGTDEIPTEYLLQVAHYRYVMSADYVDIAVLVGGNQYKQYKYVKNEGLESKMIDRLYTFWMDNVEARVKPEPKTRRDVETLFQATEKIVEADPELEQDLQKIAELKRAASQMDEELSKLQDKVCVRLKDASVVTNVLGERLCTYKDISSKRFDSTRFKKERPEEYGQYVKESVSRAFRLNQAYNFGG